MKVSGTRDLRADRRPPLEVDVDVAGRVGVLSFLAPRRLAGEGDLPFRLVGEGEGERVACRLRVTLAVAVAVAVAAGSSSTRALSATPFGHHGKNMFVVAWYVLYAGLFLTEKYSAGTAPVHTVRQIYIEREICRRPRTRASCSQGSRPSALAISDEIEPTINPFQTSHSPK